MSNQSNAAIAEDFLRPTKTLHQEVAEGIVRVLRRQHDPQQARLTSVPDLLKVGIGEAGVQPQAKMYLEVFIKDGRLSMRQDHIASILRGDYIRLWRVVNEFMHDMGHLRLPTPVPELTP